MVDANFRNLISVGKSSQYHYSHCFSGVVDTNHEVVATHLPVEIHFGVTWTKPLVETLVG